MDFRRNHYLPVYRRTACRRPAPSPAPSRGVGSFSTWIQPIEMRNAGGRVYSKANQGKPLLNGCGGLATRERADASVARPWCGIGAAARKEGLEVPDIPLTFYANQWN